MHTFFGAPNFLLTVDANDIGILSQQDVASLANFMFGLLVTLLVSFVDSSAAAGPCAAWPGHPP